MNFRGARIRHCDIRQNDDGGNFVRIHFAADFSEPVREAMEWGAVQDGAKESKLEGTLNATNLILTPNGKELKDQELTLNAQAVKDFKYVRGKEDKNGNVKEDRLEFIVVTVEIGAGAKVEEYIRLIGKHVGALRVGYTEQAGLDESAGGDDSQGKLISDEQAADTAEGTDGATLGSSYIGRRHSPKEAQEGLSIGGRVDEERLESSVRDKLSGCFSAFR